MSENISSTPTLRDAGAALFGRIDEVFVEVRREIAKSQQRTADLIGDLRDELRTEFRTGLNDLGTRLTAEIRGERRRRGGKSG